MKGRKVGFKLSEETKKKMSESRKKFIEENPQYKLKMKASFIGRISPFKGRNHTKEAKIKISIALANKQKAVRGENHHNWKGGITPINQKIRNSLEYKIWRLQILKRDNYTCVICKITNKKGSRVKFQVDHVKSFALYPESRFELSNGRTLCIDCHKKTETFGVNLSK
jgi:hypothetical protein